MESMQCFASLTFEYKLALSLWGIWCMVSIPIFIKLKHENDKLKNILKYEEFINKGSDSDE